MKKRKLTDNLSLKIMSVAIAIVVWLIVVNIDNPAVCQELREYAFSMLQTAQYLMSNNLTGKYIGYQPR